MRSWEDAKDDKIVVLNCLADQPDGTLALPFSHVYALTAICSRKAAKCCSILNLKAGALSETMKHRRQGIRQGP